MPVTDLHEDVARRRVDGEDRTTESEGRPEQLDRRQEQEELPRHLGEDGWQRTQCADYESLA